MSFLKGCEHMAGFLIGLFVGGFIGVMVMALMAAASRSDEFEEHLNR